MHFNILSNNHYLYKEFSRRNFLFFLAGLPLLQMPANANERLSNSLKNLTSGKGVALIANISTSQITGYSNLNKAIQKYTIGSIAKVITATALLNESIISPSQTYYCRGYEIINNKKIECWRPYGHGKLNIESAIAQSCNLFFLKAAQNIAPNDILNYYKKFNLNAPELTKEINNPACSCIPSSGNNNDIALGLDYNLVLTPIHMLSLACSLARKGIYKPLWLNNAIDTRKKLSINASTISIVQNGLIRCATDGTAKLLKQKGFSVAAKTGTADLINKETHGWCIGYVPYYNPVIAFCIFIENGTGFSDAVPLTAKILNLCKELKYI